MPGVARRRGTDPAAASSGHRRASLWVASSLLFSATLAGCNSGSEYVLDELSATGVRFERWTSLTADSCVGSLALDVAMGVQDARNVRVTLYYSTPSGEQTLVVVPEPSTVTGAGSKIRVPPQLTAGEPRFPQVGSIVWDGGGVTVGPRRPKLSLAPSWTFFSPDSARGWIWSFGDFAYHVVVTLEGRNGVEDVALVPGRAPIWAPSEPTPFTGVVRDSGGTTLAPRVLKLRWEDYAGLRDSVVTPATTLPG